MSYFETTGDDTILIARRGYGGKTTGLDGVLDSIGSFLKDGVKAAVNVYSSGQQSAGQAQAYRDIAQQQALAQQSRTPGWVMPVAVLGVGGVLAAVLLTRKRKNPARRRRR